MRLTEKNHSSFAKRLLKIALTYFAVFQVKIIDPERWQLIEGAGGVVRYNLHYYLGYFQKAIFTDTQ